MDTYNKWVGRLEAVYGEARQRLAELEREIQDITIALPALKRYVSKTPGTLGHMYHGLQGLEQSGPTDSVTISIVGEQMEASAPTAALQPIPGLVGPKDLTMEEWREYDFDGRTYRIADPVAFYFREGGTTHRVVDQQRIVHCVPAPGQNGCVLRWKNRGVESGSDPISY